MNDQLCSIPTRDGLLLDGAFAAPMAGENSPTGRAWVFVHGTGANFSSPGILKGLSEVFTARGDAVLRLNTRGHDLMAKIPSMQGSVPGGAAYERLDEAPEDVAAACNWLGEQDFSRISLLGHSLGGVKILLAQAAHPQQGVDELVCLSPPRFLHEKLKTSAVFSEDYRAAEERVAAGRGQELIHMREPMSLVMTAEGAVQKYGPANRFDFVPHLAEVNRPTLVVIDRTSPTTSSAFHELPETLAECRAASPAIDVQLLPHVDIGYRNVELDLATAIDAWRVRRARDMDVSI